MSEGARPARGAGDETAVLGRIATWREPYPAVGERLHRIILEAADLRPRLWYGMPGYARSRSAPVLCYFRVDDYLTFGLTEKARFEPEPGASDRLMPCAWFFTALDAATEERIAGIVRRATGAPG